MSEVKAKQVLDLLGNGPLYLHVNNRERGAVLPRHLAAKSWLTLQIGWDLPVSIPDLAVTEKGIRGTLSFSGVGCLCIVPWDAIFAIHLVGAPAGLAWSENAPADIMDQLVKAAKTPEKVVRLDASKKPSGRKVGPSLAPKTTFLRVINGGKS